jgi:hypothetical protein
MIDTELIAEQTAQFERAWSSQQEIVPGLYKIADALTPAAVAKLKVHVNHATNWSTVEGQELSPRKKLTWQSDSIIEELHMALENLTPAVNKQFNDTEKYFLGLQIWQDQPGYSIPYHSDRLMIDVAMQLYLYDAPHNCGTTFKLDGKIIDVPFVHNTGYVLKNSTTLQHRTTTTVPTDVSRYSLYAIWSRNRKNLSDTNNS